jgi:hypothetical protein
VEDGEAFTRRQISANDAELSTTVGVFSPTTVRIVSFSPAVEEDAKIASSKQILSNKVKSRNCYVLSAEIRLQ